MKRDLTPNILWKCRSSSKSSTAIVNLCMYDRWVSPSVYDNLLQLSCMRHTSHTQQNRLDTLPLSSDLSNSSTFPDLIAQHVKILNDRFNCCFASEIFGQFWLSWISSVLVRSKPCHGRQAMNWKWSAKMAQFFFFLFQAIALEGFGYQLSGAAQ